MTSQHQQQQQQYQQSYNTNYNNNKNNYNHYNDNYYNYYNYNKNNNNNDYKHSSAINIIYQIEEFIKNDYQQLRDNFLYGVLYPIILFVIGSTIIAILIQIIKYIFYPPTVYDIHMNAIKILLSNNNNTNDVIPLSSSSLSSASNEIHLNPLVPYQLMDINNNNNNTNNNNNSLQQKQNTTSTGIKIKRTKKLPSFKVLIRNFFNYKSTEDEQYKLTNEYAIQLLYNCCISNGYIPAGITLAAYYLYKLNQPFHSQNIVHYCLNLLHHENSNDDITTNDESKNSSMDRSVAEIQKREDENEMTVVQEVETLSDSSSTIHISNTNKAAVTNEDSIIVSSEKYKSIYTGAKYDTILSSINDILYDINIVKSSIIHTNTNTSTNASSNSTNTTYTTTTTTTSTTFNNSLHTASCINSMMIQTLLREHEYISIPYVQQYKLKWKQYVIQPPITTNINNNNNSNNNNTKSMNNVNKKKSL